MDGLLNILDGAFGGIDFAEEIQKYEKTYVTNSARKVRIKDVIELVRNVSFS